MRSKLRLLGVVAALGLVFPVLAADDKKETDPKPASKPEPPKEKMIPIGFVDGKITKVEVGQRTIKLQKNIAYLSGRNVQQKPLDMEYSAAENVQVFYINPPVELDDKGKPKKPNPKDLKKAVKGPGGLRGYPAEFDNLKTGQVVKVYLEKKKDKPTYTKPKKDDLVEENKPVATAVYIVAEPRN
jgi:hypothetical protein